MTNDVAQDNWNRYARARDRGHSKYIDMAQKCEQFYLGDQWDEMDRAALENEGRPALTINNIMPTINAALGEQANRRAELTFKPKRGKASEAVSQILTKMTDYILEENHFSKHLEPMVYADGLIMDRGYYDIRLGHDEVIEGEVKITTENPIAVIPDPDATNYDPRTWNEVFITRWMSLDQVAGTYGGEKKDEVLKRASIDETYGKDSIELVKHTFGGEDHTPHEADVLDGRATVRNVRVIERQYYKLSTVQKFIDPESGETRKIPDGWDDDHIENVRQTFQLELIKQREKRVRWTVTADGVVLHDDWSPYRSFTIVPYFPIFRRGNPMGLVRNLLSPQEFLNKTRSQELHIINTTANSGWIVDEGSLTNMTVDELAERGAESGIVIGVAPGSQRPEKIKPNPVPSGVDRLSQKGAMDIKEISGINEAMLGTEAAEVSGIALDNRVARSQIQLQAPFNNLEFTRQLVGQKVLELIQDFYTQDRLFWITNFSEPEQPREQLQINYQEAGRIVNDVTVGEYDVVVSSAPARDSFDEMQFAEALSLRQTGVMIPDHIIVESSHLARKTEIARLLKDMNGFGEMTPEEMEMAQMQNQLAIANAELEIEKLNAEIEEIQSKALLNSAKANEVTTGQHVKQLRDLESKRETRERELQARLQMSAMSNQSGLRKTKMQNDTRLAADAMRIAESQQQTESKNDPRSPTDRTN